MADQDTQVKPLQVKEGENGSATIDLPEDMHPEGTDGDPSAGDDHDLNAGGANGDPDAGGDDDGGEGEDGEGEDGGADDGLRNARRNRRRAKKALVRETSRQKDEELRALRAQNAQLHQRLQRVEGAQVQQTVHNLDSALTDAGTRVEYARMTYAQALQSGDPDAIVQAQEALQDARNEQARLTSQRQQFVERQRQQPAQQAPNLEVQRLAAAWAKRNPWYNAAPGASDMDTRIAKQVDQSLAQEGYDPATQEYWDEMDARLRNYLPDRYTRAKDGQQPSPRNTVGSSGRDMPSGAGAGTGRRQFTLSPERVQALKDAGIWDNPARRDAAIQRYIKYDNEHRNG